VRSHPEELGDGPLEAAHPLSFSATFIVNPILHNQGKIHEPIVEI
jgi:hypothetical protein